MHAYIYIHARMYIYIYTHMYTYIYINKYLHACIHIYITCTQKDLSVCVYMCMYTYVFLIMRWGMYTDMYVEASFYTHRYVQIWPSWGAPSATSATNRSRTGVGCDEEDDVPGNFCKRADPQGLNPSSMDWSHVCRRSLHVLMLCQHHGWC